MKHCVAHLHYKDKETLKSIAYCDASIINIRCNKNQTVTVKRKGRVVSFMKSITKALAPSGLSGQWSTPFLYGFSAGIPTLNQLLFTCKKISQGF
jgi:hypothetical protein